MIEITPEQMEKVVELCAEYGVVKLELFGSAATDDFDPVRSDLDLIARFSGGDDLDFADRFFGLEEALEALFGRSVDLLTDQRFRDVIFQQAVDATRKLIYERPNVEAAA